MHTDVAEKKTAGLDHRLYIKMDGMTAPQK